MRGKRRVTSLVIVTLMLVLAGMLTPSAAYAGGSVKVLLDGLESPKGLVLNPAGNLTISQGAFGPPAPIIEYVLRGEDRGSVIPHTPPLNNIDVGVSPELAGWRLGSDQKLYRRPPGGAPAFVADIAAYQQTDPDPFDVEDNPTETNPWSLEVLPGGDALVADAAGNDLLRVTPGGDITTVARFDVEVVSTDHVPEELREEFGLPPEMPSESVPTGVTLGRDGWVYVGELKGFPFRPGTSKVWRVNPDAEDAVCSVNVEDDDCSVLEDGFTAIADVAFDQETGTLYALQYAEDMLEFEAAFETGDFPPAVLTEVKRNKRTELAAGQLSQPGGIAVTDRGHVYVTDGMFTGGRLVLVHR